MPLTGAQRQARYIARKRAREGSPRRSGPTARVLIAMMDGPVTGVALQDIADMTANEVGYVVCRQRALGNLTRVGDYISTQTGWTAAYALTEAGREKVTTYG